MHLYNIYVKIYVMITLSLNKEELRIIIESLLFSSSIDICADWYKEDIDLMLNLLKQIRLDNQDVPIENVFVSNNDNNQYSDEHIDVILKYFPELINKNKNTI